MTLKDIAKAAADARRVAGLDSPPRRTPQVRQTADPSALRPRRHRAPAGGVPIRNRAATVNDPAHLWSACATTIRNHVSDAVWHSTFLDIRPHELTSDGLRVHVPSAIARDRIERRYRHLIEDVLDEITGEPLSLIIDIEPLPLDSAGTQALEELLTPPIELARDSRGAAATRTSVPSASAEGLFMDEPLNPRYTFDHFVCGPSNSFAQAAAEQVAEQPGKVYNPLFIYGGAGLGKTHLLHAIAHYVNEHYPGSLVRLVSTETFLNRFVHAIRSNHLPAFKDYYRRIDVLLVDDAQFFAGKEGLQEEFFHTFNTLYETSSLLVITCDRPPDSIPTLEDRLRSRFKMGLITDIQPPNIETRLAILDHRVPEESRYLLSQKVLELIAERVTNNIRELEGALTRVCAFATLNQQEISVPTAHDLLRDIFTPQTQHVVMPAHIMNACSNMFGVGVEEIMGTSRRRQLVTARHIAMYVMRELTELSFPAIASEFGDRDHTTVIHAVNKIKQLMSEKQQVYEQVTQITRMLRNNVGTAA
ncbi:MAG: chromosomal replication initiator protein DnaA [Acidimicrobiia bacterium]|nr:chromosomal replication initiator protein DnaA [Acidimicrobiia bacterium]